MGRLACPQPFFPSEKPTVWDLITIFFSEFFGTSILLFVGCMGCVVGMSGGYIPIEHMSWGFGLAVMMAVQTFGHVSGSHINPAVTLTANLLGHLPMIYFPIYFLGQVFGAIAGFGFLKIVTPSEYIKVGDAVGVCSPAVNPELSQIQGCLVEFAITLILVFVCCGAWDKRNAVFLDSISIRFGLTIGGLAMVAVPYTGTHMNPARSLGPALLNGDWRSDHWVYWVGPFSAAVVGSLIYRFLFTPLLDRQQKGEPEI